MSSAFPATYQGNQRNVMIPIAMKHSEFASGIAAVGVTQVGTVEALSAHNIATSRVDIYLYYLGLFPEPTAAASAIRISFQWQFQNAAHAALGATGITIMSGSSGAAGQPLSIPPLFQPSFPAHYRLVVPATAAEVALQANTLTITGLPFADVMAGWGIDITNNGNPGDVGGNGIQAQSATNANAF